MNDSKTTLLSNRTYDVLKALAQVWMPAVAVLYAALAVLWGFPAGFEVVGTVTALELFLGTILGLSKKSFDNLSPEYDGALEMATDEDDFTSMTRFVLDVPLDEAKSKGSVTLKITDSPS